jgi:hypothetical protein
MPIKDIKAPVAKAKKSGVEMPIVQLNEDVQILEHDGSIRVGSLLTEFNLARAEFKAAEARVKEFEPLVKQAGVKEWIRANVAASPGEPVTSIKLVDQNGSETRLTGMDKYPVADPEPVGVLFEEVLHVDPNEHVQYTLKAAFDSKVFLDKDGNFDEKIYEIFKKAIDDTAKKLNVPSPISAVKVLSPKPSFHRERWAMFNAVQQAQIFKVLPNQITLTPIITHDSQAKTA